MGIDIWGWMEIHDKDGWKGIVNLSEALDRNYSAFSVLFGVRKLNILPIGHRGRPEELSPQMAEELKEYPHDLKFFIYWCLWSEVKVLNIVNGTVEYPVYMTEIYRKTEHGSIFKGTKDVPDLLNHEERLQLMKHGELESKKYIYKAVPKMETFYFAEGWDRLFHLAREQEHEYGSENIRFTAYFE
jgi:hypothetical protein